MKPVYQTYDIRDDRAGSSTVATSRSRLASSEVWLAYHLFMTSEVWSACLKRTSPTLLCIDENNRGEGLRAYVNQYINIFACTGNKDGGQGLFNFERDAQPVSYSLLYCESLLLVLMIMHPTHSTLLFSVRKFWDSAASLCKIASTDEREISQHFSLGVS